MEAVLETGARDLSPRVPRTLAWFAIAAQAVFIAAWAVAGALEPGYSPVDRYISELGAQDAAHPWLLNAAFFVLGASMLALVPGLLHALPRRRARTVALVAFTLAGLFMAGNGVFRLDCGFSLDACQDRWEAGQLSWQHDAHLWTGLLFQAAFIVTPFALARTLAPHYVGRLALGAGLIGIAIGVGAFARGEASDGAVGLFQRLELMPSHTWIVLVAAGILHATRRAPDFGPLIPMRAREFFHGSWDAEGDLVMKPELVWRHFAQPVRIRRRSTPLTDELWRIEDVIEMGGSTLMVRRYFCELVGSDRVRVTGDDLPEGAELRLEEGGYRIAPYKVAVPVGPVTFMLRCRDSAEPLPGGGVMGTIEMSWLRMPVARLSAAVRPRP